MEKEGQSGVLRLGYRADGRARVCLVRKCSVVLTAILIAGEERSEAKRRGAALMRLWASRGPVPLFSPRRSGPGRPSIAAAAAASRRSLDPPFFPFFFFSLLSFACASRGLREPRDLSSTGTTGTEDGQGGTRGSRERRKKEERDGTDQRRDQREREKESR